MKTVNKAVKRVSVRTVRPSIEAGFSENMTDLIRGYVEDKPVHMSPKEKRMYGRYTVEAVEAFYNGIK